MSSSGNQDILGRIANQIAALAESLLMHQITHRFDQIDARLVEIEAQLRSLQLSEDKSNMATKEEIRQGFADLKARVAANKDIAQSAVDGIHHILSLVGDAAATAADLDEFKQSLSDIDTTAREEADALGAAVAEIPPG